MKCPECGQYLEFEEEQPQTFEEPGIPALYYCSNCGYEIPYEDTYEQNRKMLIGLILWWWITGEM